MQRPLLTPPCLPRTPSCRAMRKGEQSKRTKMLSKVLQFVSELLFTILYMTILGKAPGT